MRVGGRQARLGRAPDPTPRGAVSRPVPLTVTKGTHRPCPLMRGGVGGVQPDDESDTWTHTTHIPEPGYFKNVLYTK